MRTLVSVMKAAGWVTRSDDDGRHLQQRLVPIFQLLVKLRRGMGEEVIAVDLELVGINSGEKFDQVSMEASYSDSRSQIADGGGGSSKPEVVVSTVGLGLLRTGAITAKMGRRRRQRELVLKPRVMLEGSIQEILGPPSPAGSGRKPEFGDGLRSELLLRSPANVDELLWVHV
jgi:hypothetical protein